MALLEDIGGNRRSISPRATKSCKRAPASVADSRATQAKLVELQEVGFLLDENEEAVEIGMEVTNDAEVTPGRWRLHIPRVSIQEMRILDLDKLLPKRKRKATAAG